MLIVNNAGSGTEHLARKMTCITEQEVAMATKPSMAGQGLGLLGTFINGVRSILESTYGKTIQELEHLADTQLHEVVAAYLAGLPITIGKAIPSSAKSAIQCQYYPVRVTMDLNTAVTELIALGKYDQVDSNFASVFPDGLCIETLHSQIELLHYSKNMSSEDVLAHMERQGLRPATFPELLWIGIQHPLLQLDFPIVALGSVVLGGSPLVAFLNRDGHKRLLGLCGLDGTWGNGCRFAAASLPVQVYKIAA